MDLFLHPKLFRILRFLISGGSAAVVNLGTLYTLTEHVGLWYILSACIAFLFSFGVSFTLQKFWTFRETSLGAAPRQVVAYFIVAIINFVLNVSLLFALVEFGHLHYVFAELIVMVVIACASFFVYRNFIFKVRDDAAVDAAEFFLSFRHALILLSVALFSTVLPLAIIASAQGETPKLPVAFFNEADYYYDRMHEVVDGNPFLGNPYFIEHKNDPPPAFVGADWLSSIPLLVGIPLMQVVYLNLFGWSLAFLLLSYGLIRAWRAPPLTALLGAILTYATLYSLMLRPVAMQIVFPFFIFFLLAFLLWLREPHGKTQQILFGIAAAVAASLYTYAWQIIVVVFPLSFVVFASTRRQDLKTLIVPSLTFFILTLPFMIISVIQTQHPLYAETLARIGLIKSHLPVFLGFVVALIPIVCGILAFVARRQRSFLEWARDPHIQFFAITGTAVTGVMLSNIITGLDLELPQHIERFVILWFVFISIYLAPCVYESFFEASRSKKVIIAVLVALMIGGHVHYQKTHGIATLFLRPIDTEQLQTVSAYDAPLTWLRENVREPAVIWSNPESVFANYVAMATQHYVLFQKGGGLQLVSDEEVVDRYLTAHYFSLSFDELVREHHVYAGTGNAVHPYKTHNRKVFLCRVLRLDMLGAACGNEVDAVTYTGREYFSRLMIDYQKMRPAIEQKLKEYQVDYIVYDRARDAGVFEPSRFPFVTSVYDDGRFIIFSVSL